MGKTTIEISDELADELYERKEGRGDTYEAVIWRNLDDDSDETETASETTDDRDPLADWSHGRSAGEVEASDEIAAAALEWLADRDEPATRSDVPLDEFAERDRLDRSEETLWTEVVRDSWQHCLDGGLIEQPHGRAYNWVGGDV